MGAEALRCTTPLLYMAQPVQAGIFSWPRRPVLTLGCAATSEYSSSKERAKGSPYKLGFLVAQAADGIFKSLGDADAVDAMERAIVSTIRVMAMQRKAEFKKGTDAFDMSSGFNPVRDEGVLKEILKGIVGKQ